MFSVVLFEPEIPPNTGNIIRLCANAGASLHLIQPLGFSPTDKHLRRAGLDYADWTTIQQHENFAAYQTTAQPLRIFACSTHGLHAYHTVNFKPGDTLLFGPETRGLPKALLHSLPAEQVIRIPMVLNNRSLNLSNAVAIILYEAWRQLGFVGGC